MFAYCADINTQLSLSFVFAECVRNAEDELLFPGALRVPGCVCGAHHPPGPTLASPTLSSIHHPMGRSPDQSLPPCLPGLHLPWKPTMD